MHSIMVLTPTAEKGSRRDGEWLVTLTKYLEGLLFTTLYRYVDFTEKSQNRSATRLFSNWNLHQVLSGKTIDGKYC